MWLYQGKEFNQDMVGEPTGGNYGFVYIITNDITGQKYIGKKFFWSKRTLPPLKGKTRKRHVIKPSDWLKYYGSSNIVKAEIDEYGIDNFSREIISIHPDKRETNFAELCEQIMRNVLDERTEDGKRVWYNENIDRIYYPSAAYGETRTQQHRARASHLITSGT